MPSTVAERRRFAWLAPLRAQPLLWLSLALSALLAVVDPRPLARYRDWLDAPSLAGLLALLAVARAVVESGYVQALARALLRHVHGQRALALWLVALAGGLSMLLTNDVALFLVVPLTLALCEHADLPRRRLVIVEALAVNAGSTLSPVGNPQNLLLWNQSGTSMLGFAAALAPAFAMLVACLVIVVWRGFPAHAATRLPQAPETAPRRPLLGLVAGALLLAVLVLLQLGRPFVAAAGAVAVLAAARPGVLGRMDWGLLLTLAAMLLGLGHLVHLPAVMHALSALDWSQPLTVLLGGAGLSQLISNVPATVALRHAVTEPLWLAVAVNIGGAGLAIGSLANLIALRLEGSRAIWREFHRVSIPYFLVTLGIAAGWVWLNT